VCVRFSLRETRLWSADMGPQQLSRSRKEITSPRREKQRGVEKAGRVVTGSGSR
jgi:hypothetical protein